MFMNELSSYLSIKTSHEMVVDMNRSSDKLKINIDIVLKHLPCSIVSLDVQDIMGTHSLNMQGKLLKQSLDKDGKSIGIKVEEKKEKNPFSRGGEEDIEMPNYEDVRRQVIAKEGCRLAGNIEVLRVPGNFHFSSRSYATIISRLLSEGVFKIDMSHKINHISFGDESDIKTIMNKFDAGILNPLDGISKDQKSDNVVFEYYVKVVPTTYEDVDNNKYYVHQFTSNTNEVTLHMTVPSIFFKYDISPILVKISQYRSGFFHFFIQICAIIGGIFTVTGIIDTLIHRVTSSKNRHAD
jgi:hypothetical protein